jgi:hypothetical protein
MKKPTKRKCKVCQSVFDIKQLKIDKSKFIEIDNSNLQKSILRIKNIMRIFKLKKS